MKLNTLTPLHFHHFRWEKYKKRNPRAIPSLNSYFPFTLHTLVEKRERDPSRFAPSVQYIPIEEEGKIPSSTIANLPKRFTRIHSSLLKFPRNDHSIVHGRPRIGAESSFIPTPDILYRRWKGAFIVAARRVYSIFSSRTSRVHPRFLSAGLGFFNPFTSCPPYPKRARVSSWLEFFELESTKTLDSCIGMKCNFHPANTRENLLQPRFEVV